MSPVLILRLLLKKFPCLAVGRQLSSLSPEEKVPSQCPSEDIWRVHWTYYLIYTLNQLSQRNNMVFWLRWKNSLLGYCLLHAWFGALCILSKPEFTHLWNTELVIRIKWGSVYETVKTLVLLHLHTIFSSHHPFPSDSTERFPLEVSLFSEMLTLKISCQLFYQQKVGLFRTAENFNLGQANYGKTTGKSWEQRRGLLFYGQRGHRRAVLSKKSTGVNWQSHLL